MDRTTLSIYRNTKEELEKIKQNGQSYNTLIQELIREHNQVEEK